MVLGISFHATGYMIADPWVRGGVSLVIALTVFMFDRALYQSDWFYQGFLWQSGPAPDGGAGGGKSRGASCASPSGLRCRSGSPG